MVRQKRDRLTLLLAVLAVGLAIAALTFYLWHLNEMTRLGYESARLEEEISRLQEEVRKLETEKAGLLTLNRVEKIARQKLHLTDPQPGQVFYEGRTAQETKAHPPGTSR
jgi:cell division protein FtsL